MLYLFEFFELNNLHVVMTLVIHRNDGKSVCTAMSTHELLLAFILFPIIVQIIDYVHPKSVAKTARIDCRCVDLIGHGKSVFVRTSCGGTLTFYR